MSEWDMENGIRGQAVFRDVAERNGVDPDDDEAVDRFFAEGLPGRPEAERAAILDELMAETTSGMTVRSRHEKAMEIADLAIAARRVGNEAFARRMFAQAFRHERQAALEVVALDPPSEPTRSVLLRSAADLGIQAGAHEEAANLARTGLAGDPPPEIRPELEDSLARAGAGKAGGRMRYFVAVRSHAAESDSAEAARLIDSFIERSGATVVGDRDHVATAIESDKPLEELARIAGASIIVERPIKFRPL